MKKPILLLAILTLFFLSPVYSANINGNVYGPDFDELVNTIITINTTPQQQIIAKISDYSFIVPNGRYILIARYFEQNTLKYESIENITISQDGNYTIDLLLFPRFSDDIESYPNLSFEPENNYNVNSNYIILLIIILSFIGVVILSYLFYSFVKKNQKKLDTSSKEDEDEYYNKIIEMLEKNKRLTQKDIRKEIPLSEAKISLILTEMESKAIIKKIRKGRSNIIILNKE